MRCIKGSYAGRCIEASAACEDMELCVGENHISICSELETLLSLSSFFFIFSFLSNVDVLCNRLFFFSFSSYVSVVSFS